MNLAATAANYADRAGRWSAIALGFTIPISVALDSLLLAVVLAGYVLGGDYREKWRVIRENPIALAALALFAMLLVGVLYGERNSGDAALYLGKYLDLLWIPVLLHLFRDAGTRGHAVHALAASLALVLLWSFLVKLGIVPKLPFTLGDSTYPVVFKHRLTHNLLMAFGAFLFVHLALTAGTKDPKVLWAALALLAVANITFMVQGATGYLILGALVLYFGYGWRRWRGLSGAGAAVAGVFIVLALVPGPFQQRMAQINREVAEWTPGQASASSSVGLRLEFYRVSLEIVRDHPLIGVGTGGFPKAYAEKARGPSPFAVRNPHNEYLLIAVQTGLLGLALLLNLFWQQWRLATRLATPIETHLARGLLITIAVGCLFNSLLLDHTEGLLYAWMTGLLFAGLKSERHG
jgi:O-antigen ligase